MTRRVHIVGCRRSGTTLMMELLWYAYPFTGRAEHEQSVFVPPPPGQTLYLSKKPPDTLHIETVFRADENLYLIAMLRDPRAVMTSRHPSRPDVYFSDYVRWARYVEALRAFDGHPRFLQIRFEDLVQDPAGTQSRVEQRLPWLARKRAFTDYPQGAEVGERASRSLGGLRPFDAQRISAWREHLPRVKSQLAEHPDMPQRLIDAGYEQDADWTAALEGAPAYHQRYKDGGPGGLRRLETRLRFARKTRRYLRRLGAAGRELPEG